MGTSASSNIIILLRYIDVDLSELEVFRKI